MKMLDLFSGIGGFALAARWTWEEDLDIVGFCEIEEYCQKVLQKNFPNVPIYDDIKKLDGNLFNDIDLITGGFPCQDISQAGRGAGIGKETRSGLWFEMLRIISEVRPRYAIIENVPMLTIRGGTRVIEGLAEIGYDAEWVVIGANDVGAWHTRKRIWIDAVNHVERVNFPTPTKSDVFVGQLKSKQRTKKSKHSVSLSQAVTTHKDLYPTPQASAYKGVGPLGSKSHNHRLKRKYLDAVIQEKEQTTGRLNPQWVEWLMGYPIGWTELKDSETQ